jgi:hypothetical protein
VIIENDETLEESIKSFEKNKIYKKLKNDFDYVSFYPHMVRNILRTPRQIYGEIENKTIFSASSFYYIQFLLENNPKIIHDLGCGWNIFKKYIPNIVGVDSTPEDHPFFYADVHALINEHYVKKNQGKFESIISINSLTFGRMSSIRKTVEDFVSMLQPGGRAYLAFNTVQLVKGDPEFSGNNNLHRLDRHIRTELSNVPWEYLVFESDNNPHTWQLGDYLDGDLRMVIYKNDTR